MKAMSKIRLDQLLINHELAQNREEAQRLIRAGKVLVEEKVVDKPGHKFTMDTTVRVKQKETSYVSRGGLKLEAALRRFSIHVQDWVAVDLGASTGGFTDCLLRFGAKKVFAIDVGYGQLAYELQVDPRVVVMDRTNCRYLKKEDFDQAIDLVVGDLSFISIKTVFPAIRNILNGKGELVLLIKPQFEIGKGRVGKKGIVRSKEDHYEVLSHCCAFFFQEKWSVLDLAPSPLQGKTGNMEFLLHSKPGLSQPIDEGVIRQVVEETYARI